MSYKALKQSIGSVIIHNNKKKKVLSLVVDHGQYQSFIESNVAFALSSLKMIFYVTMHIVGKSCNPQSLLIVICSLSNYNYILKITTATVVG